MNTISFKKYFSKKYRVHWIVGILVIVVIWFVFFRDKNTTETLAIHQGEFLQQVAVSGKIVATENINLSFEQAGQVRGISVKEGDKVRQGQLLANQDTAQLAAQLAETRAGINLQEAKLQQLLAGASPEDIKVFENKAQLAQQNLYDSYDNALTVLDDAYAAIYGASKAVIAIQMTYFSSSDQYGVKVASNRLMIEQALASVKPYLDSAKNSSSDSTVTLALSKMLQGLRDVYDAVSVVREQCDLGMYYSQIPASEKTALNTQKTTIINSVTNVKSSQQDVLSYKISLEQANNELASKKAPPRQYDIAVYEAQIEQARASEQNILAQLQKRQIYSPIDGIVTKVNAKLGSIISANEVAISIISSQPLEIESYVPEIYVSIVRVGNAADVTLDAYGADTTFQAQVISIDPSETLKDGVSSYRTKLQFVMNDEKLKSGMSANVIVTTEKKENVISVPQGVVMNRDGKHYVKIQEGKNIVEREVTTGIISSLGGIEITSGLNDGDVVILK